jgi:hypothetical protein
MFFCVVGRVLNNSNRTNACSLTDQNYKINCIFDSPLNYNLKIRYYLRNTTDPAISIASLKSAVDRLEERIENMTVIQT